MSYILMTRMQYFELTGVVPRFRRFECDWERENKERFRKNHSSFCERNDERNRKNEKIYQKFDFNRQPKEPLSNDALTTAIKICSEQPSKCFYMEEALSQLGYYHIYSYEDRLNALMQATNTGSAILVEEGFGGGGASLKEEKIINDLEGSIAKYKETHKEYTEVYDRVFEPFQNKIITADLETKLDKIKSLKGIKPADYKEIMNIVDAEKKEDIVDIILTINNETDRMLLEQSRFESPYMNNFIRLFEPSDNKKTFDCFDQALRATQKTESLNLKKDWLFSIPGTQPETGGLGHAWGMVRSKQLDTFVTFDPRSREFGVNRWCDSCSGWLGLLK